MYTTLVVALLFIGYVCAGWTVVRKLSRGGRWEHDNDCDWSSQVKWLRFVLKVAKLTPSEKWEINSAITYLDGWCECGVRRRPSPGMTLWMWPLVLTSIGARASWEKLIGSAVVE